MLAARAVAWHGVVVPSVGQGDGAGCLLVDRLAVADVLDGAGVGCTCGLGSALVGELVG